MIPVLLQSRALGASGLVACRDCRVLHALGLDGDEVVVTFHNLRGDAIDSYVFKESGSIKLDGHPFVRAEHAKAGRGCIIVEMA